MKNLNKYKNWLIFILIYLLIYLPGLNGPFLFDDFANLNKLGDFNGIRNLDTFFKYLASGIAGPTGRPISLLSFLVNATNWPADPFPFKLTNVLLHGLNGFFLFLLCRILSLSLNAQPKKAATIALVATSFWLLHPFFVSTVLYVVQRMAMLSTFFSIAGLWLYCKGRLLIPVDIKRGYSYMSLGIGLGTLLALLSKENGILLPLLAACVELCIFRHPSNQATPLNRYWAFVFLLLPSLLVLGYLLYVINPYTFSHPFGNRNFTLPERLLTESRIVTGYLYNLLIPKMSYPGILNENIQLSKNLWEPIQTLYSVVFILLLPVVALFLRRQLPYVSLAILFFLAGHLLESTTIGLELYFEHRNYLPAIFLFMPVGQLFVSADSKLIKAFVILMLFVSALFTQQLSKLWGNELELTLYWAKQNPDSARAQRTAAMALEQAGQASAALNMLTHAKQTIPDNLDIYWHWLILKCHQTPISAVEFNEILHASEHLIFDSRHFNILQATVETMLTGECQGLDTENALNFLDVLMKNPGLKSNPRLQFQLHHLKGIVYSRSHRPKQAFTEFETVLSLMGNVEHGLVQIGILASQGYFKEALLHLQSIENILAQKTVTNTALMNAKPDYQAEIKQIKQNMLDDLAKTANTAPKN
ncbi:hypothetical protein [Methylicorpusculum sp.]|uniref:hypothetical protein n=1 Tax=Methylicorpusculum sp. TaxID=2713644 RepID=UPI002723CC97|nr:hypothetical protein [Methylicorpusculum sp.]MDO8844857.1 hypothetical protein [Methylicorpusculum sp.]